MMKNVMTGTYIHGEENYAFDFYTDLSYADKLRFVNSVVDVLVDEDNYHSIIRDLLFDFYVVDIFTNVDTTELKASAFFVDDVEEFLEETNIVDIVRANASPALFDELNKAVNQSIEYRTGIHHNPLNEALARLMSTLEKKINEVDLDDMMSMVQKFAGMADELTPENIMDAYMASDVHKKNLAEIEEVKKAKE